MSDYECDKDKDKFRSPSLYDTTLESYWHEPEYTEEEMSHWYESYYTLVPYIRCRSSSNIKRKGYTKDLLCN